MGAFAATVGRPTIAALVEDMAERGAHPAVLSVNGDAVAMLSYGELAGLARRLAAGMVAAGVRPGEPVLLFGPNSADWIVVRLALACAGAVAVALDDLLTDAEIATLVPDSGAAQAFVARAHLPRLRALPTCPRLHLLEDGAADGDAQPWRRLLAAEAGSLPPIDPGQPAMLVYTSGTTGTPKAFLLTHANIMANVDGIRAGGFVGPGDRALLPLPLHHVYPLTVGVLTPLGCGTTVVLPEGVTGPQIVKALRLARVTAIVGVPRLYAAMLAGLEARVAARGRSAARLFRALLSVSIRVRQRFGLRLGRRLFASLHRQLGPDLWLMASGGARFEADLIWRLEGLGWEVLSGYGLAETASILTCNRKGRARIGSEGLPLPGAELRIAEADARGVGEVQTRGPSVFAGYRNNAEANAAAFTADGWFRTGDLGRLDADGHLYIAGRVKEMIVLGGGKNVFPEELEKIYAASPCLREVALLEERGALVALVLPDFEAIAASGNLRIEDVLRVTLAERAQGLPSFQRLAGYAIVREPLPRTRLGKYQRFLLPELYARARAGRATGQGTALSEADRAWLAQDPQRALWAWLQARYPDKLLALDLSPQLDLGIDSLEWVTLGLELDERFGVRLTEDDMAAMTSLREFVTRAAARIGAPPAPGDARPAAALTEEQRTWLAPARGGQLAAGLVLHALDRLLFRVVFRLRVEGLAHVPADGAFVIVANHASDLDPLVVAAALPPACLRRVHWSGDAGRVFGSRLGRALARVAQIFPVDERSPATTLGSARAVLREGRALVWFPESWRSPDGELQRFLPGIGALIDETGVPAVPARIFGAFEAMPRGRRLPRPRRIRIVFGPARAAPALAAEGEGDSPAIRIAAALRAAVAALR